LTIHVTFATQLGMVWYGMGVIIDYTSPLRYFLKLSRSSDYPSTGYSTEAAVTWNLPALYLPYAIFRRLLCLIALPTITANTVLDYCQLTIHYKFGNTENKGMNANRR